MVGLLQGKGIAAILIMVELKLKGELAAVVWSYGYKSVWRQRWEPSFLEVRRLVCACLMHRAPVARV